MSELTNYIEERIEYISQQLELFQKKSWPYQSRVNAISELQAVLSKIEEIDNLHNKK